MGRELSQKDATRLQRPKLRKLVTCTLLITAAVALLAVVGLLFGSDYLLNHYVKARLENAFTAAHPNSTLQIGRLQYYGWDNQLVWHGVRFDTVDSSHSFRIAFVSMKGVRWVGLLFGQPRASWTFARAVLNATNLVIELPNSQYVLHCRQVTASIPRSELEARDVEFRPGVTDEQFFAALPFRRARLHLSIPNCRVTGFNGRALLTKNGYQARSIEAQNVFFETLINRDKPVNPKHKPPLMPHEALARIKPSLQIDHISAKGRILLTEQMFGSSLDPGALSFESIDLQIDHLSNLTNTPATILAQGQTRFMNAATLKMRLEMPAASRDLSLKYSGSLGAMDLAVLNPFLAVTAHSRMTSGRLQEASFQSDVTAGHATGQFWGLYQNVDLEFLDRETGSEKGLINRLKSLVAGRWIVRSSNLPDPAGSVKIGTIDYTRKPEERFFHFLWYGIRSGMVDVLGIADYVKAPH